MVTVVSAKCPNCGAVLSIERDSDSAVCQYCGTRSSISRSKAQTVSFQALGTPVIYVSPVSRGTRVLILVGVACLVITVAATLAFQRGSQSQLNVALIGDPVLADVDGDGFDDVIVQGIAPGDEIIHLRAYSGKEGKSLWVSEPLLKTGPSKLVATVPGLVVTISDGASVVGLDATTGKSRFRITPPERVEAVCQRGHDPVLLTKDNKLYVMNAANGALTSAGVVDEHSPLSPSPPCSVARSNRIDRGGTQMRSLRADQFTKTTEMSLEKVFDFQGKPPYLMLGNRTTGSRVPMIGARTAQQILWMSDVPGQEPLGAVEGAPIAASMTSSFAYAAYVRVSGEALRVAGFALADGRRLWEAELPINDRHSTVDLAASDQHVFVFTSWSGGKLRSLNSTNGQLEWSLGG